MLSGAVTNRYARGLLDYAKAHNRTDELDAQLSLIGAVVAESNELRLTLANPVLSQEAKLSIIEKLVNGELHQDLRNFLALLLRRGRGHYVAPVARRFHELVDELHGRVVVDIETAQPLTDEQTQSLVTKLAAALGKQVEPNIKQNPNLIAGYRVQVGNRVLDATTQNALRQFRETLLARAVHKEGTR